MKYQSKELTTTAVLLRYSAEHRDQILRFEYASGESYLCTYDTDYDSGNDEYIDDCHEEEEWNEALYEIRKVIVPGPHYEPFEWNGVMTRPIFLRVYYKDFPARITTEDGEQVYPVPKDQN